MSILVWAGCGIVSCVGAICYIELGCLIPKSGGDAVYLKAGLGDVPSFLYRFILTRLLNCQYTYRVCVQLFSSHGDAAGQLFNHSPVVCRVHAGHGARAVGAAGGHPGGCC